MYVLRSLLKPGDLGAIVRLHGLVYAAEQGFDASFEAYVAGPLAEFVKRQGSRERLWIAERADQLLGSIAIVEAAADQAQLRWFLVEPGARGLGLGRELLQEAIAFARAAGYAAISLWTVSALARAAALYRAAGFDRVEQRPGRQWGVDVVEEKYLLQLNGP